MGTLNQMIRIHRHIKAGGKKEVTEIRRDSEKSEAMGFIWKERQEEEDEERGQGKKERLKGREENI